MRDRTSLSQQNWLKEKDELIRQESYLQSEFEQAKEAMHNWEVLAMEERSIRENMGEKIADLEEQLAGLRDAYDRAAAEHESQTTTVDGLQRALQDIQAGIMTRKERHAQSDGFSPQTGTPGTRREFGYATRGTAEVCQCGGHASFGGRQDPPDHPRRAGEAAAV